jgi:hypothetical protein
MPLLHSDRCVLDASLFSIEMTGAGGGAFTLGKGVSSGSMSMRVSLYSPIAEVITAKL